MSQTEAEHQSYVTVKYSSNLISRGCSSVCHRVAEWMRESSFVFAVFSFCRRLWRNLNRFVLALLASRAKQYQLLFSYIMIALGLGFLSRSLACSLWKVFCPGAVDEFVLVDDLANFIFSFGLCSFSNLITWEWIYANTSTSWKIFFNTGLIGGFGSFFTFMFLLQVWGYFKHSDWCTIVYQLDNNNKTLEPLLFLSLDMGLASVTFMYASYTITNQSVDILIIAVSMILIFFVSFLFGMLAFSGSTLLLGELSNNLWAILIVRSTSWLLRKVAKWIVNRLLNWGLREIGKNFKRKKFKIELRLVVKYTFCIPADNLTSSDNISTCSDNEEPRAPANTIVDNGHITPQEAERNETINISEEDDTPALNTSEEPQGDRKPEIENAVHLYVNINKSCKRIREEGLTCEYKTKFDIKRELKLGATRAIGGDQIQSITAKLEYRIRELNRGAHSPWLPFIYDPGLSTTFEFHQSMLNMHEGREFDIPVDPDEDITLKYRYMAPNEDKVPCLLRKIHARAKPSGGSIYVQLIR